MLIDEGAALVVDRAAVFRHLMSRFLSTRYPRLSSAASVEEARRHCVDVPPSLVVLDATLEDSFEWLSSWGARTPRPAFAVVTSRPSVAEGTRASLAGAIGYLPKPVSVGCLLRTLALSSPVAKRGLPRVRALPIAEISVADPITGSREVTCEVRDLGLHGAFVEAAAPIPLGTRLRLSLRFGSERLVLGARVVRVQEPAWGTPSGWGLAFDHTNTEALRFLEEFVLGPRDATAGVPAVGMSCLYG